jgi:putative ABC transport system permease protein
VLALGMGVSATAFRVLNRLYFAAPLGVKTPNNVRRVQVATRSLGGAPIVLPVMSGPHYRELASAVKGLADVQAYDVKPGRVTLGFASEGFFRMLGVRVGRGRAFVEEEDVWGDPRSVVVVRNGFAELGEKVRVDSVTYDVIGVLAPGFDGLDNERVDVWAPLAARPAGLEAKWYDEAGMPVLSVVARLARDVSASVLEEAMSARLASLDYGSGSDRVVTAPLSQVRGRAFAMGAQAQPVMVVRRLALLGGIVLLIAALNVACMLLMRTVRRRRELATRIALGLTPSGMVWGMVRLVAAIVVSATVAGWGLARWGEGMVLSMLLPGIRWGVVGAELDWRMVAMAAVGMACATAIGVGPALLVVRDGQRQFNEMRLRGWLMGAQAALSAWLVVVGVLLGQSLRRAQSVDVGFDYDAIVTVNGAMTREIADRVAGLPGVEAVALMQADARPGAMSGGFWPAIGGSGRGEDSSAATVTSFNVVEPTYFKALGVRVIQGRVFTEADAEPVAVVTEAMARAYWPGRPAVGECFYALWPATTCRRVVGVIADMRWDLRGAAAMHFLLSTKSTTSTERSAMVVRGGSAAEIRNMVAGSIDRTGWVVRTGRARMEPQMRPIRTAAVLFSGCGAAALVAAAIGVFSLVAYGVAQRTHELAVRMSLGAPTWRVLREVSLSGVAPTVVGSIAGLGLGALTAGATRSLLFETGALDPGGAVGSMVGVMAVAGAASLLAGRKALAIQPALALKEE